MGVKLFCGNVTYCGKLFSLQSLLRPTVITKTCLCLHETIQMAGSWRRVIIPYSFKFLNHRLLVVLALHAYTNYTAAIHGDMHAMRQIVSDNPF